VNTFERFGGPRKRTGERLSMHLGDVAYIAGERGDDKVRESLFEVREAGVSQCAV
jgi:hypothetical protein